MELLGVGIQITIELLGVLGLKVVLLLALDNLLELRVARVAHTLALVALDALIVESVPAHEVDRWQLKLVVAAVALLRVEVLCLCLEVMDLLSHGFDLLEIVINLLVVLPDDSVLHLKSVE